MFANSATAASARPAARAMPRTRKDSRASDTQVFGAIAKNKGSHHWLPFCFFALSSLLRLRAMRRTPVHGRFLRRGFTCLLQQLPIAHHHHEGGRCVGSGRPFEVERIADLR